MVDKTLTGLTEATTIAGTDLGYARVGANSRKFTWSTLAKMLATGAIALTAGTITTSQPLTLTQTWNAAGVTFTGLQLNVTDTASVVQSLLMDLRVNGTSVFGVRKNGSVLLTAVVCNGGFSNESTMNFYGSGIDMQSSGYVAIGASLGGSDVYWRRDGAGIWAQRNGTNPQAIRLYNTFTDASNYERGFSRWTSNEFQVGTEAAGTGVQRNIGIYRGVTQMVLFASTTSFQTTVIFNGDIIPAATNQIVWGGGGSRSRLSSPADGQCLLQNNAQTDWSRLMFGGTTSAFPALKRSATVLQARLADDTGFAPLQGNLRAQANAVAETPTATHTMIVTDAGGTAYRVLCVV